MSTSAAIPRQEGLGPQQAGRTRFSLSTNFDDALPSLVVPYAVFELYGKLPADVVGGGRARFMLAPLTRRRFERHLAACRKAAIGFNYLLNSTCLDNREYTKSGQRRIRQLLDWLASLGVNAVTVANPFLLRLIKTSYPAMSVRVSVFASVNDVRRVRYWEDLGADCIALDSIQINREFELLRRIREAVQCRLELLASNDCLQSCPLQPYHPNFLSHASQQGRSSRRFAMDWCLLWCSYRKLIEPVNYIRADWIRPEDLEHYERIGFHEFKLTERGAPTEVLLLRARAYAERRFNGNLLDLVQPYGFKADTGTPKRGVAWVLRYFLRPGGVQWRKLPMLYALARERGLLSDDAPVYVDNRALDGFIDRFLEQGCRGLDCEACRYCHRWAARAVRIDEPWARRCIARYQELFRELESGSLW